MEEWLVWWAEAGWVPEYGGGVETSIGGRTVTRWAMIRTTSRPPWDDGVLHHPCAEAPLRRCPRALNVHRFEGIAARKAPVVVQAHEHWAAAERALGLCPCEGRARRRRSHSQAVSGYFHNSIDRGAGPFTLAPHGW
jgi:hypothetical protein